MTWPRRHHAWLYISQSIWVVPFLAMPAAMAAVRVLDRLSGHVTWGIRFPPETVQSVLAVLAGSMCTFIVFVTSALLVAVQLASAQLTPRIIPLIYQDPVIKVLLTWFVFSFTLTLGALLRSGAEVPVLTTQAAALGCMASVGLLLYMIDHVGRRLRPSGALRAIAAQGRRTIDDVYPNALGHDAGADPTASPSNAPPGTTVTNVRDGVILAVDVPGLVALARRADCVIELVPQVGDFVAAGEPLFHTYHGAAPPPAPALRRRVALGWERTMEQDPAFAFRVIVDIACKALSPAINDPTTAVQALDQLHHLLRTVGRRDLTDRRVRDQSGAVRLLRRTPEWADFVHLATTEIRQFGRDSIQISRRLRAMLENLIATLPPQRIPLLREELAVLEKGANRAFSDEEDRRLACQSDSQGVGGRRADGVEQHAA